MKIKIKSILNNKIIVYLNSRYAIYGLQFIIGMVVAGKLGPFYMGVYGFLQMVLMYINNINLGIPHSLNVFLIHNKDNQEKLDKYIANSLVLVSIMSLFIGLFYLYYECFGIPAFEKFKVDKYLIYTCIIGVLTYYNIIIQTVIRIKNKLKLLTVIQSLTILLQFCIIWFFKGKHLIAMLLISDLLSNSFTIYLGYKNECFPKNIVASIQLKSIKEILKKGFYLFLYNSCFYFIVISVRTIISNNYSVEEFGMFTFSFSLGNALLLISSSISVIIFPKMLHQLSSDDLVQVERTLSAVRVSYISATYCIVFLALPFFPLLLYFLPQYKDALYSMNFVALAVLMNTNSFGYSTLLIARNKEKYSAFISILSLILNMAVAMILVNTLHVNYELVILSVLATYLFFSAASIFVGTKIIGQYSLKKILFLAFPIRLFIPYMLALLLSLYKLEYLIYLPFIFYVILNYKDLIKIIDYIRTMVTNQNMTDL